MISEQDLRRAQHGQLDATSHVISTTHVLEFVHQQLGNLPHERYRRLAHGLAEAGKEREEGEPPLLAPFDEHAGRLLHHLPDALAAAESVHEIFKSDPNRPHTPLHHLVRAANHVLHEHTQQQDYRHTPIRLRRLLKSAIVANFNGHDDIEAKTTVLSNHQVNDSEPQSNVELLIESLDKHLEGSSPKRYEAIVMKLQKKAPSSEHDDTATLFIQNLPKSMASAKTYAQKHGIDWRVVTQLANHTLYSFLEGREEKGKVNLRTLEKILNAAFKSDLHNPFIATDSLPTFSEDPEVNRKDATDRNNVLAIRQMRATQKILNESNIGEISPTTSRILESWGIRAEDILQNADKVIADGIQAGSELGKKYTGYLKFFAKRLSQSTSFDYDYAYELAMEGYMRIVYEYDIYRAPFRATIGNLLPRRMIDIARVEKQVEGVTLRSKEQRIAKKVIRYLEERGLQINDYNINEAIGKTESLATVEQVSKTHAKSLRAVSLEATIASTDGTEIKLVDTLASGGGRLIAGKSLQAEDPTFRGTVDGMENFDSGKLMEQLLDIPSLDERTKLILRKHYVEGKTLDEIGKHLGLTESRISQLHTAALAILRGKISRNPDLKAMAEDMMAVA